MRVATTLIGAALLAFPAGAAAAGDPLREQQWGLSMIEADAAHAVSTGAGAVVAVIDTGVLGTHPDLAGRLLAGRDFVQGDDTPHDGNGHGTHVSGIVAANAGNGIGVSSVAPGAQVLPVRVLADDGSGTVDDVAAGIDWAVARGADVINLSLGDEGAFLGPDAAFAAAIDRALDRGVVVAAAAGNSGLPVCEQPDGEGRLLCVGAVDRRRTRGVFSSFGRGLGLMAPGGSAVPLAGEGVLSTFTGPEYDEMSGTSQAAPHVAGVAALLVAKGVRGQAAVQRMGATAVDAGPPGPDPEYGAGIVNARRALEGLDGSGPGGGSGGPTGGDGPGGGASARVSVRRVQRIRAVLKRGVRVRCLAAGAGRCRAVLGPARCSAAGAGRCRAVLGPTRCSAAGRRRCRTLSGRAQTRLAAGSRALQPGVWTILRARPTPRGRRLLRLALRRGVRLRARLRVTLPGTAPRRFPLLLRP
jgi:subtilisin family serine protease